MGERDLTQDEKTTLNTPSTSREELISRIAAVRLNMARVGKQPAIDSLEERNGWSAWGDGNGWDAHSDWSDY